MSRVSINEIVAGRNSDGFLLGLNGASVQINVAGGAAATVYEADTGGATLTNPLTSSNGRVSGYLAEGSYDLIVTYQSATAAAVRFEARAAYPNGASDGQVLTWDSGTSTVEWADPTASTAAMPWTIDIDPKLTPATQTNWTTLNANTSQLTNGYASSSSVQNDEIGWDVIMAAGTWTISILTVTGASSGIITASLDGTTVGTIDLYSASTVFNSLKTITGIAVSTSGKQRLLLKMAAKNPSSSSYAASLSAVRLLRTA